MNMDCVLLGAQVLKVGLNLGRTSLDLEGEGFQRASRDENEGKDASTPPTKSKEMVIK